MKNAGIHVLLIALATSTVGCGGGEPDVDQSTPQAALRSFGKAMSERDWEVAFACMDEESQYYFLGMPIMQAQFIVMADESRKASLDELFEKHGYEQPPMGAGEEGMRRTLASVDNAAFFGDLVAWHEENQLPPEGVVRPDGSRKNAKGFSVENYAKFAEFPDFRIEIDGDTAKSQAMGEGNKGVMHFKRIDGKWHYDYATTWKKMIEKVNERNKQRAPDPGRRDGEQDPVTPPVQGQ